jgi:hypothetical protein
MHISTSESYEDSPIDCSENTNKKYKKLDLSRKVYIESSQASLVLNYTRLG